MPLISSLAEGTRGRNKFEDVLHQKNKNNEIMRLRTVQENETNYLEEIKTKEVICT